MTRNSSNELPCKPFQTIPTADLEYIITKTLAPGNKTRTLDTKVLNQLPNLNILNSAHEYTILNDISSADEPKKIRFQQIHRLYKLHFGKFKNQKEVGYQAILGIKLHTETLSSNILGKEKNVSKIINMKDNSSESEHKNKLIDQFQEIKRVLQES